GVREDGSLRSDFKARLDKCIAYSEGNGGTIVVTGKKGRKEPVAEAVAGKNYLVKKGVPEGDIRVDDQSKNTYENIRNAY
ncbi:MAG: YdcF family protein, partial [Erysipelotrichaceae bacterium]|nr:YdcF family protein [Erysipelotrichaceae bacterium]